MRKCVFAGTFDPFTVGHADTVQKCLRLFDEVIVALAENKNKNCKFSLAERAEMINVLYKEEQRVRLVEWSGVVVDLLRREHTPFYVRGVRNTVDLEYENANFYASRDLDKEMVTIYIPAEREHVHVSSTLVKNCISFGKPYETYLPPEVYAYLQKRG